MDRKIQILVDVELVSIPSSSGHQFTAENLPEYKHGTFYIGFNPFFIRASVYCVLTLLDDGSHFSSEFQSLLHQGISLLKTEKRISSITLTGFQSLLHQGISLLHAHPPPGPSAAPDVSIPSSSGHQFTESKPKRL